MSEPENKVEKLEDSYRYSDKNIIHILEKKIKTYYIAIDDSLYEPKQYRIVNKVLREANSEDTIIFDINTDGGDVPTVIQIINEIQRCKAKCKARIFTASSSGAILALCCDEIEVMEFGSMMVHNIKWEDWESEELEKQKDFVQRWSNDILNKVYQGFLTETEFQRIKNGEDIWFCKDEIENKLKNWKPWRNI